MYRYSSTISTTRNLYLLRSTIGRHVCAKSSHVSIIPTLAEKFVTRVKEKKKKIIMKRKIKKEILK